MSHPWTPFLTYLLHRKTRERTTVTGLPLYPRLGLNLNTSILGPRKCSTTCASTLVASCPSPLNWTPFEPETIIGSNSTDSPSSASSLSTTISTPSSARNCYPHDGKHRKPFTRLSHGPDLSRIPQTQSRGQRKHGSIPEHHLPGYFTCRWARAQALVASSTTTETSLPIRSPPSITTTQ